MTHSIKKLLKMDPLSVSIKEYNSLKMLENKVKAIEALDEVTQEMKYTQLAVLKHNFSVIAKTFDLYNNGNLPYNLQGTSKRVQYMYVNPEKGQDSGIYITDFPSIENFKHENKFVGINTNYITRKKIWAQIEHKVRSKVQSVCSLFPGNEDVMYDFVMKDFTSIYSTNIRLNKLLCIFDYYVTKLTGFEIDVKQTIYINLCVFGSEVIELINNVNTSRYDFVFYYANNGNKDFMKFSVDGSRIVPVYNSIKN